MVNIVLQNLRCCEVGMYTRKVAFFCSVIKPEVVLSKSDESITFSCSKESHLVAFPLSSNRPEIVVSVLRSIRLLLLFSCTGNLAVCKVTSSKLGGVMDNIRSGRFVLGPSELKVSVVLLNFSHDGVFTNGIIGPIIFVTNAVCGFPEMYESDPTDFLNVVDRGARVYDFIFTRTHTFELRGSFATFHFFHT